MHCCGFHVTVVFSDCLNSILTKRHESKLYKCYRQIVCVCVVGGGGGGGRSTGSSVSIVTILRTRRLENLGSILRHSGYLSAHHGVQTGSDLHLRYVSLMPDTYSLTVYRQFVTNPRVMCKGLVGPYSAS